ncbi:50S ribosomal protein L23 [Candidatus Parcubacteria bacterium]|nr:50S ribosomal protein L23 [Candidatus Parcubacteria bacterium]
MKIFNIFKKKEKPEEPEKPKPEKSKKEIKIEKPKKIVSKARKDVKPLKATGGQAYRVLKIPHITEKATDLTKNNQYVFKVLPKSNKIEIKKAIEGLYGVDVLSVRIINIPSKKRRLGKTTGWKKGYKKAIIKIKQGQKIEVMPR